MADNTAVILRGTLPFKRKTPTKLSAILFWAARLPVRGFMPRLHRSKGRLVAPSIFGMLAQPVQLSAFLVAPLRRTRGSSAPTTARPEPIRLVTFMAGVLARRNREFIQLVLKL